MVVYTNTIPIPARAPVAEGFKRTYGIKVEMAYGSGVELAEKIAAEQRAKAYVADVSEGGAGTKVALAKPRGLYEGPINVPSVYEDVWRFDPWASDPDKYIFNYYPRGTGIMINTNLVKPQDEPKSWLDLLDPKWKGKLLMGDPSIPGPSSALFTFVKNYVGGEDYWRKMVLQDPKIVRGWVEGIEMMVRGEYSLMIGPHGGFAMERVKAGAPLKFLFFKEGVAILSWSVAQVKNAPHPNAGKLFINWFLSRDGQLVWSQGGGFPSMRKDVPQDHVHPQLRIDPSEKILAFATKDYLGLNDDMSQAADIFKIRR